MTDTDYVVVVIADHESQSPGQSFISIHAIKVGDIIIKYPIFGEPVDKIDYTDESKISRFQAIKVTDKTIDLASEPINGVEIAGMSVNIGPLHKSKIDMVEDKKLVEDFKLIHQLSA